MRRKIETKIIAALLSCAMMTGMAADCMGVYADENNEPVIKSVQEMTDHSNKIKDYDGWLTNSDDFVDDSAEDYHNNEVTGIEMETASVKEMEKQVAVAQKAAEEAADAVDDLEKAIDELKTQASNAQTAAGEIIESDVTAAENEASGASEEVEEIYERGKNVDEVVSSYNTQVDKEQKDIDSLSQKKTNDEGAVSIEEMIAPSEEDSSVSVLVEQADNYAATAAQEASNAKEALEAALAVESDEADEEIKENIEKAVEAAANASKAAEAANDLYENSLTALENAKSEYNLYAMVYGMPLYGKTEITYLDNEGKYTEEAKALLLDAGLISNDGKTQKDVAKEIENTISSVDEFELDDSNIKKAEGELNKAKEALEMAQTNADTALENIEEASNEIVEKVGIADEAANKVTDYYVAPAKADLEKTNNAIEAKNEEINGLNSKLTSAQNKLDETKKEVKPKKEEEYDTELAAKKSAMDTAKSSYDAAQTKYDKAGWWDRIWNVDNVCTNRDNAEKKYNNKKSEYDNYKNNKVSIVNDLINADATVKKAQQDKNTAQTKYDNANGELKALNSTKSEQEKTLKQAETTRDAYIKAAGDKATQDFLDGMAKVLKENSDMINQVEYDKAVNEFVNDAFNTWSIISKFEIRNELNGRYIDSFWERFGNTLAISQWAISTKSVDTNINRIKQECEQNIVNYLEELEMAEANWAKVSADAQKTAMENMNSADEIEAQTAAITVSSNAISSAETRINSARDTYNAASSKLAELQGIVDDIEEVKSISLDGIKQKLAKAQQVVDTAKQDLDRANASKAAALNYQAWATSLLEKQQTVIYNRLTGNEADDDPEFVMVEGNDGSFVEVPYSVYKAYVEKMYDTYSFGDRENYDTISTDEKSMKVLFWEMDEDGVLTGKYYCDESELPKSGKYFIGNTFGFEDFISSPDDANCDKLFRMEGVVYKYDKPKPDNGNGNNGNNNNGNGGNDGNNGNGSNYGNGSNGYGGESQLPEGNVIGVNTVGAGRNNGVINTVAVNNGGVQNLGGANADDIITIDDNSVALADNPVAKNDATEKSSEEKGTVKITENDTPLAASAEDENSMPWWMVAAALLLAAAGAVAGVAKKNAGKAKAGKANIK